jgi:hypothetical protein
MYKVLDLFFKYVFLDFVYAPLGFKSTGFYP